MSRMILRMACCPIVFWTNRRLRTTGRNTCFTRCSRSSTVAYSMGMNTVSPLSCRLSAISCCLVLNSRRANQGILSLASACCKTADCSDGTVFLVVFKKSVSFGVIDLCTKISYFHLFPKRIMNILFRCGCSIF